MKKHVLLVCSLFCGLALTAQVNKPTAVAEKSNRAIVDSKSKDISINAKAFGDTIWQNDFSTPADWAVTTGAGHTAGVWAIVTALPGTLTAQVATYGFPAAMNSTSGGEFALINSDAEGSGAIQNSSITTTAGVDMSALGSTAVIMRFTEIYRHYQESFFVGVSNDGGVTWTEFVANDPSEVPVNTNSADPETESINVTAAIGAGTWGTDVRVRFRYSGTYDWFWGVDDVQLVEALEDDIKVSRYWLATDVATTQGLDYYQIPLSQTSFPGLTFGANIGNNGAVTQSASLNATSGAYDQTGTAVSVAVSATDSVSVTTPFMVPAAVGSSTIAVKTVVPNGDDDDSNNSTSYDIERTTSLYGRDDNNVTGSFTNFSTNTGNGVKIGNMMEIFDPINAGYVDIYVGNIAASVGENVGSEVYIFDVNAGDYVFYTQTEEHTITTADLGTFVSLPFVGSGCSLAAGDVILLLAYHNGGTNSPGFGMAQPVEEQTVLGYIAGVATALSDPNAIMIRLNDFNNLSLDEATLEGVSIYPNPSNGIVNVSIEKNETVSITVFDMLGQEVLTKIADGTSSIDLSGNGTGMYLVKVSNNNGSVVERVVIK